MGFFIFIEGNVGFKGLRNGLSHLSAERASRLAFSRVPQTSSTTLYPLGHLLRRKAASLPKPATAAASHMWPQSLAISLVHTAMHSGVLNPHYLLKMAG